MAGALDGIMPFIAEPSTHNSEIFSETARKTLCRALCACTKNSLVHLRNYDQRKEKDAAYCAATLSRYTPCAGSTAAYATSYFRENTVSLRIQYPRKRLVVVATHRTLESHISQLIGFLAGHEIKTNSSTWKRPVILPSFLPD